MIRRFYCLPVKPGTTGRRLQEFAEALTDTDRFIAGTQATRAGRDLTTARRTVLWENTFTSGDAVEEYLRHPYHSAVLDDFVMPDSPVCAVSWPTYTVGYEAEENFPDLDAGVRRIVLLEFHEEADVSQLRACITDAQRAGELTTSVFARESWAARAPRPRTAARKAWTHIWEQGFANAAALERYLGGRSAAAAAERAAFRLPGLSPRAVHVMAFQFGAKPARPEPAPAEDFPARLTVHALVTAEDGAGFMAALEQTYDPALADAGLRDPQRSMSTSRDGRYLRVMSTWELGPVRRWHDARGQLVADPRWQTFVRDAMPCVRGGGRWLSRIV